MPPRRADGLRWGDARRTDRHELQAFICADPDKHLWDPHRGRHHPAEYALDAQSVVRSLKPPVPDPEAILVGRDDEGIAVVASLGFDSREEQFTIHVVARALRCAGLGYGRAAIEKALIVYAAHKKLHGLDCGVFARIHPDNEPSKAAFSEFGFARLGVYDGLEIWVRDV